MKEKARVLAVDDSPFKRFKDETTFLVGLLFRGLTLEAAAKERIRVDGDDSTEALVRMCESPGMREEVRLVLTHGTTFGGLNVLDMETFHDRTGLPIASCVGKKPTNIERALLAAGQEYKLEIVRRNPKYRRVDTSLGTIYCAWLGVNERDLFRFLVNMAIESKIPEPLRIVDIVASLLSDI